MTQRFCTSCGQPVDGMKFCTSCGTPVAGPAVAPAPPSARLGTAPEPSYAPGQVPPPPAQPPTAMQESVRQVPPPPARPTTQQPTQQPTQQLRPAPPPPTARPAQGVRPPVAPPPYVRPGPPEGPRRRGRLVWVTLGVVVVLLIGAGAFALGTRSGHDDGGTADASTATTTPSSSQSPRGAADAPSSAPSQPDASPSGGPATKVATRISGLLTKSVKNKADIQGAVDDLFACRRIPHSIAAFASAARARTGLVADAHKLDTSDLPGARQLVTTLVDAWTISARADRAYATWGRSVHKTPSGCGSNQRALKRAGVLSTQSHAPKQKAARLWKPIARTYGLPTLRWSKL